MINARRARTDIHSFRYIDYKGSSKKKWSLLIRIHKGNGDVEEDPLALRQLHVVELPLMLPLRVRDTPSGRETVLSMHGGLDALGSAQAGGGPALSLAAAGEPANPLAHALQADS